MLPTMLCGNALWKTYALWNSFSKCVGTKSTNFEKKIQCALNFGPTYRSLKFCSKCVKSVHLHFFWICRLLTHFEKKYIHKAKLLALLFHLIDRILKRYYSFFKWEQLICLHTCISYKRLGQSPWIMDMCLVWQSVLLGNG